MPLGGIAKGGKRSQPAVNAVRRQVLALIDENLASQPSPTTMRPAAPHTPYHRSPRQREKSFLNPPVFP